MGGSDSPDFSVLPGVSKPEMTSRLVILCVKVHSIKLSALFRACHFVLYN